MTYSIADLEQLSGVSAHNIRIWERRYKALEPLRSSGNTRYYSDDQFRRLLNIISLNQAGIKISKACSLSETEMHHLLEKEIDKTISADKQFEYYISQIISNGFIYNEQRVNQLICQCLETHGVVQTYKKCNLSPVGSAWADVEKGFHLSFAGAFFILINPAKIFAAINDLPPASESRSKMATFST